MNKWKQFWDEAYGLLICIAAAILALYSFFTIHPKVIDSDVDCYKFVGTIVTGLREEPQGFNVYKDLVTKAKEDGYISLEECIAARDLSENLGKRKLVFQ